MQILGSLLGVNGLLAVLLIGGGAALVYLDQSRVSSIRAEVRAETETQNAKSVALATRAASRSRAGSGGVRDPYTRPD